MLLSDLLQIAGCLRFYRKGDFGPLDFKPHLQPRFSKGLRIALVSGSLISASPFTFPGGVQNPPQLLDARESPLSVDADLFNQPHKPVGIVFLVPVDTYYVAICHDGGCLYLSLRDMGEEVH